MSKTIQGKWQFNKVLDGFTFTRDDGPGSMFINEDVNFTSNSNSYTYFEICGVYTTANTSYMDYDSIDNGPIYAGGDSWLLGEEYRTIDFGTDPQEVSEEFYNFFVANARLILQTIAEKLQVITENEQRVFDAGKKAEYDAFWDEFQAKNGKLGARDDYQGGFYGVGWNDETFKPKYDMNPSTCASMFVSVQITDLDASLKQCGVTLDTTNAERVSKMFFWASKLTKIPTLNCTNVTRGNYFEDAFNTATKLETIEKIILREDGTQTFSGAFTGAKALKNITFEGVIGQNIDFKDCTLLTHESLTSIINALQQYNGDGKTHTVTLGQANISKLSEQEIAFVTQKGWTISS